MRQQAGLLLCLMAGAAEVRAAPGGDAASDVANLRAEVQRLRKELLQYRAEVVEWKLHAINTELQSVRVERQRLGSERELVEREIGELNQASTNAPGMEDEGRREELSTARLPALLASERAAIVREAALVTAFNAESARMEEIRKRLHDLTGPAAER